MAAVSILSGSYRNLDDPWFNPLNSGDTITIDGTSTLIINSDVLATTSSWGGPQNVTLGSITLNDGTVLVDGRFTRLIPFSGSSAAIMTGSKVTGSTSQAGGEVIAVYTSPGVTAEGWVKLRTITSGSGAASVTASFESGSLIQPGETLIFSASRGPEVASATAATTDRVGFLTICGKESATITTTRLANFIVRGSWYEFENSGSGLQPQYFLPPEARYIQQYTTGSQHLGTIPAIWVETESGSNDFVPWVNAGNLLVSGSGVSGSRANTFFHQPHLPGAGTTTLFSSSYISASFPTGYIPGRAAMGNIIPKHARVRIPNIHFISQIAGDAKGTSSFNTAPATRYDFTTTNAGVIDCDKALATGWYFSLSQPYSAVLTNCGLFSTNTTEVGTNLAFYNCGIGAFGLIDEAPFTFTGNYGSSIISNTMAIRLKGPVLTATSCKNLNVSNSTFLTSGSGAATLLTSFVNCANVTMSNSRTIGSLNSFSAYCDTFYIVSHSHQDAATGSTTVSQTRGGFTFTNCNNFLIDSLITESAVGTANINRGTLFSLTSCNNMRFRNIGSPSAPYPLSNLSDYPFSLVNYNTLTEISRCYFTQSRTGFLLSNNSNAGLWVQNSQCDRNDLYAPIALDVKSRGLRMSTGSFLSSLGVAYRNQMASVYGTHYFDTFLTDTTGSIGLWAIEATSDPISAASYQIINGPVNFDSLGGVRLQYSGSEIIWTWPWYVKGHRGFLANKSPQLLGTGSNNLNIEYQLDDGNGFSGTWASASTYNLAEESASIDPAIGFKMKIRTRCTTTNLTNILYGMIFYTSSSLELQQSSGSLYPLDTVNTSLTFTNVQSGSEIRVYTANTQNELASVEDGTGSFSYNYTWEGLDQSVDVQIVSLAYEILRYEGLSLGRGGVTIPLQQRRDRNYYNPD